MGFQWIGFAVALVSAFWVHNDAKKYKEAGKEVMNPLAWAVLVFFFWIIAFPIYLILKFGKYDK